MFYDLIECFGNQSQTVCLAIELTSVLVIKSVEDGQDCVNAGFVMVRELAVEVFDFVSESSADGLDGEAEIPYWKMRENLLPKL